MTEQSQQSSHLGFQAPPNPLSLCKLIMLSDPNSSSIIMLGDPSSSSVIMLGDLGGASVVLPGNPGAALVVMYLLSLHARHLLS